eukprot:4224946-Amphidinium_carterae.1
MASAVEVQRTAPAAAIANEVQPTAPATVTAVEVQPTAPAAVTAVEVQPTAPATVTAVEVQPTAPAALDAAAAEPPLSDPVALDAYVDWFLAGHCELVYETQIQNVHGCTGLSHLMNEAFAVLPAGLTASRDEMLTAFKHNAHITNRTVGKYRIQCLCHKDDYVGRGRRLSRRFYRFTTAAALGALSVICLAE